MSRRCLPLFLILTLPAVPVTAAAAGEPAVAAVQAGADRLEWLQVVEAEAVVLSIADPQGRVRALRFAAGEAPALSLFDERGAPLPDGTYTWELRVQPRAEASSAPLVQSGHFTISGSALVAPDLVEAPEVGRRPGSQAGPRAVTAAGQLVPDNLIVDGRGASAWGAPATRSSGPTPCGSSSPSCG